LKTLPSEEELRTGFNDFLELALDFLQRCEQDRKYLKAAAVNAQIALELFLKYYIKKRGEEDNIRRKKGSILLNDYADFSQVLGYFYSTRKWSYGEKKELIRLLEARNSIVHRGQDSGWDEELAIIIARVFFFIHGTSWAAFEESVLFNNYKPHEISTVSVWRKGAESFAKTVAKMWDAPRYKCLSCHAFAVVSGEVMSLDDSTVTDEDMICLCCLSSINVGREARLIQCYNCHEKSYWIDAYNEQENQLYVGKCTECDTNTWVRKCPVCEDFYHPSATSEVKKGKRFFCSRDCKTWQ
jgi:HEPN domain-containing protein